MGLTISGAVSLGAYEGGALAALITAVQALDRDDGSPITIDAIGGASAGSITGMLTARCLLEGLDPVHVMSESWVRRDSLATMRTRDKHAPLSVEAMRRAAVELLDPPAAFHGKPKQTAPIRVHMALGCLRGLRYQIGRLEGPPLEAETFLDWGRFELRASMPVAEYTEPKDASIVDFALASAANAFGFPPKVLKRTERKEDLQLLDRNEITNLPSNWSGYLWYTDGGTIDNEPLGRTFEIANELDADGEGRRIHLLIHPHPDRPSTDERWTVPSDRPNWTATFVRCDKLQRTQSIYEDVRHAEKTNSRLVWSSHLQNAITPLLEADDGTWAHVLANVLETIEAEKEAIRNKEPDAIQPSNAAAHAPTEEPKDVALGAVELFRRVLTHVTGLASKEPARIDVVSPLLLPEAQGHAVEDLLAGEFLFHFGGFLDERLRWNDFALGYRSMQVWLEGLEALGIDPGDAEVARDAARTTYRPAWNTGWGGKTLKSLPFEDRVEVARLVGRIARVSSGELLFGSGNRPGG
jgi:predicted acylesterase/phospholipase RssA